MVDANLQVGAHVTPNIRLVRQLGQGGMGSVWVADHLGLHTQVVVKFVAGDLTQNAEVRERFAREAALSAQAKSPHVVQVLDHGTTASGIPYIAMELLEGEDLGKRIERERLIPPLLFADWLTQACKGLGRAHAKGIVHRDIKPENLFLCDVDGEIVVKVLDFGIAKGTQNSAFSRTKTGAFLGTAYFMSPEQTMGSKQIDLRTDLWSMAVTAYLALTGARPFEADSLGAIVAAITMGPIAPPSSINPQLGPAIDAWMTKALARPLDQRFSSAKEMADAFAAAARGSWTAAETNPLAHTAQAPISAPSLGTAVLRTPPAMPANIGFSTSVGVAREQPAQPRTAPAGVPASSGKTLGLVTVSAVVLAAAGAGLWFKARSTPGAANAPPPSAIVTDVAPTTSHPVPSAVETLPPPVAAPATSLTLPPEVSVKAAPVAAPRHPPERHTTLPPPAPTTPPPAAKAAAPSVVKPAEAPPPAATPTNRLKMGLE